MQEIQEMQVRSLGQEEPLEVEMAIHSSILAWKIQWTEESGGLQSKGSQRVGHDLATEYTHICLNGPWNINAVTIVMVFFYIYNVYINTIICSLHELVTSLELCVHTHFTIGDKHCVRVMVKVYEKVSLSFPVFHLCSLPCESNSPY